MTLALVDRLRALPAPERRAILGKIPARQLAALRWCWRDFWARPDDRAPGAVTGAGQLAPRGAWSWWISVGGRGSGKTKACVEWVNHEAGRLGKGCIVHLLGATIDDAQATMVEGPSGILESSPPWARPDWKVSKKGGTLVWPSGAVGRVFGADKPSKGRGPQCNRFWVDDPAAFGPHGKAVLDQLLWGFRIRAPDGTGPRGVVSTTPIDTDLLRWLLAGEAGERKSRMVYSRSATDDNRANLSDEFFEQTIAEFAGTELEQQERYGVMGAFRASKVFRDVNFGPARVTIAPTKWLKKVLSIDPAKSGGATADRIGMQVVGLAADGHAYALAMLGLRATSAEWPRLAVEAAAEWDVDEILVEVNTGSWAIELLHQAEKLRRAALGLPAVSMLRIIPIKSDRTKATRASALVPLYRQLVLHHLPGHDELERQLREIDEREEKESGNDDADAWEQAVNHLFRGRAGAGTVPSYGGAAKLLTPHLPANPAIGTR